MYVISVEVRVNYSEEMNILKRKNIAYDVIIRTNLKSNLLPAT